MGILCAVSTRKIVIIIAELAKRERGGELEVAIGTTVITV